MAEQNGGVIARQSLLTQARGVAAAGWIVLSILLYFWPCGLLCLISRKAGYAFSRIWASEILATVGVRLTVAGLEKLDSRKRYIFVSNHQSHLDIPCLMSRLPFLLTFIAKKELFRIPFFGWSIAALGHISMDRSSPRKARDSFSRAVDRLKKEDISVVIFPEGTRSASGLIGDFKRASFTLAIESGLSIVPVAINGTYSVLSKESLLPRSGAVTISISDPIATEGLAIKAKDSLCIQVRERIVAMMDPASAQAVSERTDVNCHS